MTYITRWQQYRKTLNETRRTSTKTYQIGAYIRQINPIIEYIVPYIRSCMQLKPNFMNKNLLLILLTIFTLNSCQSQTKDKTEIYKTESDEYASESGNFTIKFPMKPTLRVIDNQIGTDKYKIYNYQAVAGQQMIYMAEYIDFPKYIMESESWTKEQAYNQILKTLEAKYGGVFRLTKQEPTEQYNLNGQYFEFSLNPNADVPKGLKGGIKGKLFFVGNRSYQITYFGEEQELIEPYLNSFRLIK
ncbi:MAG: hypothetical protein ACSHXF_11945 [Aquaticitalea sp.]